jgi:hypothetical protein
MRIERRRRRAGAFLLVALAVVAAACTTKDKPAAPVAGGTTLPTVTEAGEPGSPQRVGLQLGELPSGFRLCDFSGEIGAYIENHKTGRKQTYDSLVSTWAKLQSMGATEGYYAVYGDSATACDFVIGRSTVHDPGLHEDNARGHPTTAYTFVARYRDEAAAAEVYTSDTFGQKGLRPPQFDVVTGEPTGLGPNSVVASNKASQPVTRAVWQARSFTVVYGSENLKGSEPDALLDAVYGRIPAA